MLRFCKANIVVQGEMGRDLHILTAGEVGFSRSIDATPWTKDLGRAFSGKIWGENAILRPSTWTFTVRAVTAVTVLILSQAKCHELLGDEIQTLQALYSFDGDLSVKPVNKRTKHSTDNTVETSSINKWERHLDIGKGDLETVRALFIFL